MDIASQGMYQNSTSSVFARLMASSRARTRDLPGSDVDPVPVRVPERVDVVVPSQAPVAPSAAATAVAQPSAASSNDPDASRAERAQRRADQAEMRLVQREVAELKRLEQKLHAHEMAHLTAAGQYARGGMQFGYERGPDGVMYATSGEVNIDASPVPGDPEATLRKAQVVQRAALAPAEPSPQDRSVAARAVQMASQARVELAVQRAEAADPAGPADPAERNYELPSSSANALYASVGVGQVTPSSAGLNTYA